MIRERLTVFLINIFCPPLAVMLIAGPGMDCLINTLFFIAGVLPGHIHGFYITCTYFHRKRKVRKGRWPGGRKMGIYSEKVWWGGASWERVEELKEREMEREWGVAEGGYGSGERGSRRESKRGSRGVERGNTYAKRGGVERTRSAYGAVGERGEVEAQTPRTEMGMGSTRSAYAAVERRDPEGQRPRGGGRTPSRRVSVMSNGTRGEMVEVQGWRL